jgi:hypothetical protein
MLRPPHEEVLTCTLRTSVAPIFDVADWGRGVKKGKQKRSLSSLGSTLRVEVLGQTKGEGICPFGGGGGGGGGGVPRWPRWC